MSDLISQIQIDEIQAEPTFADWQEFQAWLDSLPADEPLYFPDGEQGLTRKPRPSRGYSSPHYSNRGIFLFFFRIWLDCQFGRRAARLTFCHALQLSCHKKIGMAFATQQTACHKKFGTRIIFWKILFFRFTPLTRPADRVYQRHTGSRKTITVEKSRRR